MNRRLCVAVLMLGFWAGAAEATLLNVDGDFSIGSASEPLPELGVFSGSFSFLFDNSVVSASGFSTFIEIPLSSLVLNPNYGSFDTGNTFGNIQFFNGLLDHIFISTISDEPGDDIFTVIGGTNDFLISYYQSTDLNDFAIANKGTLEIVDDGGSYPYSGSVTVTAVVPEPSGLWWLGGLAIAGMFFRQKLATGQ